MDQAFSIKNLRHLLNEDKKKGGQLEEKYIPTAHRIRWKIYFLNRLLAALRHRLKSGIITCTAYDLRVEKIRGYLDRRTEQHEYIINSELDRAAKALNKKDFRIRIIQLPTLVSGKIVYGIGNNLESILAVRFAQRVLKEVYSVRMPGRDILVSQIKSLAHDGAPKYIIKADIKSFYESVRHRDLLESIHQSPNLSVVIKRLLTRVIKDYAVMSGSDTGLPRGIGVSAYLAEIYLTSVDRKVKSQEGLFYYSRYVDDMLLMYAPKRKESVAGYLPELEGILSKKGLHLNDKTKPVDLIDSQKGKFDYLGYEFDFGPGSKGIRLSFRKDKKYRERIEKSFNDYFGKRAFIPKKAAFELIERISFLTGNVRLFNRKSNAFVGVYFSNKHITDTSQLKGLDDFLRNKIKTIPDIRLKRRLEKFSFSSGFSEKLFRSFDAKQLSAISKGWNHG